MQKKLKLNSFKSKKNKKSINKHYARKSKKINLNGGGNDLKVDLLWTKITPDTIESWHSSQTDFFTKTRKHIDNIFEHGDWSIEPLVTLPKNTSIYWIFKKNNNNNYYIKRLTDGNFANGKIFSMSEISKFSDRTLDGQIIGNISQIEIAIPNGRVATYNQDEIQELKEKANSIANFIDNSNNNNGPYRKKPRMNNT